MAVLYVPEQQIPNVILVGVPNSAALQRVLKKLETHQIKHYVWEEPDFDFGMTAIATIPISGKEREPLANYRLYSPVAQLSEQRPLKADVQVEVLPGEPFPSSSGQERPAFSWEVGGW